jgi:hypothetical protein
VDSELASYRARRQLWLYVVQLQGPQRVDHKESSRPCEASSSRLRRSGRGLQPYSNVMREDEGADLWSLSRAHAELDVEQITASGVADGYDRWMLQLPLRGDRKEATVYFLNAADSSQAVLLFQSLFMLAIEE